MPSVETRISAHNFRPGGRNFKGRRVLAFLQAKRKLKPLPSVVYLARAAVSFNYRRVKNLSYSEGTFRLY